MFHFDMRSRWVPAKRTIKWTFEEITGFETEIQMGPPIQTMDCSWYLELRSKKTTHRLVLVREWSDHEARVKYDISILDSENVVLTANSVILFNQNNNSLPPLDTSYETLFSWKPAKIKYPVTILATLDFSCLRTFVYNRSLSTNYEQKVLNALSKDAYRMYDKKIFCDANLKVGKEIIKVHRFVLIARSPVFAEILANRSTDTIEINDVSLPVLKVMLDYMYSKMTITSDFDIGLDVYKAADKYKLNGLRDSYGKILFRELKPVNAGRLLKLANQYQDWDLKSAVLEFVRSNYAACLQGKFDIFVGGKSSELYKEVLEYLNDDDY